MRRLFTWLFAIWLTTGYAWAADNTVILTPGSGVTMRSKDVGSGVQSMIQILGDTSGNALATAPGTPNASFALPVQGVTGGTAIPVSGTITVTGVATAANQTNASQKTQIVDGSGNVIASTSNALNVNVSNANANGQATMANSSPVVIASNQSSFPVAATLSAETTKVIGAINNLPATVDTNAGNAGASTLRTVIATNQGNLPTINGASLYQAEPASTSITALTGGGGGATGDYLSHCTVVPATTSPGVFTITDGSTAIYSFPGGASSLSNLVPWTVPVGAKSATGAWKVTTGANLSIVCVGKFT